MIMLEDSAVRLLAGLFVVVISALHGQEVGLDRYLERLKPTHGLNIEDKVLFQASALSLSPQGVRELRKAASVPATSGRQTSAPTIWQVRPPGRSSFSNDYPMDSYLYVEDEKKGGTR